jgi:hypothetical protein
LLAASHSASPRRHCSILLKNHSTTWRARRLDDRPLWSASPERMIRGSQFWSLNHGLWPISYGMDQTSCPLSGEANISRRARECLRASQLAQAAHEQPTGHGSLHAQPRLSVTVLSFANSRCVGQREKPKARRRLHRVRWLSVVPVAAVAGAEPERR